MKSELTIDTTDGLCRAFRYLPEDGSSPRGGILFFMDAMGPRDAMHAMAQRLADAGYFVLLPDLFYRFGSYGPFSGSSFGDEVSRNQLINMITTTTQEMTSQDTAAFLHIFDSEGLRGPLGVVGYCMGGGRALTVAGRYPERFAAAASFHGANLASMAPDSPHLLADKLKARVYIGMAGIDGSFPPEQSTRLTETFRTAGVDFTLENYVGVHHGWTVPDRDGCYDEAASERHWRRLLFLMHETLDGAAAV